MGNRRFSSRVEIDSLISISPITELGTSVACDCKVTDYTETGVGLLSPVALAMYSHVRLRIGTNSFTGQVRYCVSDHSGAYRIGLRLVDGQQTDQGKETDERERKNSEIGQVSPIP